MMKRWLEEWIDFLFPESVEQDMDGIEVAPSITEFCREVDGDISGDIPKHLRRLPVLEPDDTPLVADHYVRFMGSRR